MGRNGISDPRLDRPKSHCDKVKKNSYNFDTLPCAIADIKLYGNQQLFRGICPSMTDSPVSLIHKK